MCRNSDISFPVGAWSAPATNAASTSPSLPLLRLPPDPSPSAPGAPVQSSSIAGLRSIARASRRKD
eukprot:3449421-Pyramimonas_sp.AAC.1